MPRGLREAAFGLRRDQVRGLDAGGASRGSIRGFCVVHSGGEPGGRRDDGRRAGCRHAAPNHVEPLTQIETMTTYIVQVIGGEASFGEPKYLSLFAVGLTLFAITLTLNIISGWVLRRFREVYQ